MLRRRLGRDEKKKVKDALELLVLTLVELRGVVKPELVILVRRGPRELARFKLRNILIISPTSPQQN